MTPKIDAALEKFRNRTIKTPETSTVSSSESIILSETSTRDKLQKSDSSVGRKFRTEIKYTFATNFSFNSFRKI